MNIDLFTLVMVLSIANVLQIMAMYLQYKVNKAYQGIGWWVLGFTSMAMGYTFLLLRDLIPIQLVTIICANTLILLGPILTYIGIMRFLDRKENRTIVISVFAVFMPLFFYYTYVNNHITLRTVIIYAATATISFLTVQGLVLHKIRSIRASLYFNAVLFLMNGCFFTFRAAAALAADPVSGLFAPSTMQIVSFLYLFVNGILLTFGLIIMINQRLNAEMREAKEHFELIFNTSPDAALISRLSDGVIADINDGFTAVTGLTRDETIGKTSMDINVWENVDDRQRIVRELGERGFCENMEVPFRRKDGSRIIAMLSAKPITLHGSPHIISVARDITARKEAEEALHEERRRLQKALDEVKTLRGIVPICANCKKIRDDKGYWNQVEMYISAHSEAEFSHGICPECVNKLYPEFVQRSQTKP